MQPTKFVMALLLTPFLAFSAPETPENVLKLYFNALAKRNSSTANQLTAHFPKFGEPQIAQITAKYIEMHKRPGYSPSVHNSKTIDDCAVVVILESPTDPDPVYLLKQAGNWKVLPKLTQYRREEFALPETMIARFQQLENWFKDQKPLPRDFDGRQLVGQWRHVDLARKLATTLTFKSDGTYTGKVEVNGKANGTFAGKWSLKDGTLYYIYTTSADKMIPAGTKDQDILLELKNDRYTIQNALGLRETYTRISN